MKKKFTFMMAACIMLLVFVTSSLAGWGQTTVTYSQTSTSAVSVSTGTAPEGSTASFSTTYNNNMNQLTSGNSMTLTLSGYEGYKITGITLSMKSNASKGAGSLSVVAGSITIASIADSKFNTNNWYGSWSTSYVDVNVTMTNSSYEIQENENVVITIAASENSLYCQSFKLTYEAVSGGGGGGGTGDDQTLTFPFTSNISGWPTTNPTTLTNYTYTLDNVAYTFALKNVRCNSTYLMCSYPAVLGLPAIENYKLTKVVAYNSTGCSTSTKVGISSSSSSESYISGGALQTWSTTGSSYTYNLSSTETNTMYYLYVTNKNAQVVGLELTYEYVAPSAVATPTFNLADGYYVGTQNVTISCETVGATIYYTTDGSTPSASNGTQGTSVSISATTTLKAIAIKDEDNSSVAEATYTILTPLTTMQAVYEDITTNTASHMVAIAFNNWIITGTNGSNPNQFYLTDATNTYGCVIYGSGSGFVIGNTLSGTVLCNAERYTINQKAYPQLTNLRTTTEGLTVGTGGSVTANTTTIDQLSGSMTGTVIKLDNLTYNGSYLADENENKIVTGNYIYTASLESGKTYNITGVLTWSYSSYGYQHINPRSSADIVEVVSSDPTIYASPKSLTGFTYGEGSGPSAVQTITVSGSNLEDDITLSLNDGNDSAFEISFSENSGYANTLNLTQTNGTIAETTVYVRMKVGLSKDDYEDQINITSTDATQVNVNLTGKVTGPKVTLNLATNSYASASANEVDWTSSYVNMTLIKGQSTTNANNYLGGDGNNVYTRMYKDQVLTFAPVSGYAISNIEIKAYSTSYANAFVNSTWTNATASASSDIVTIVPTNGNNNVSVTFGSACWVYQVTVYYEASTLTPHNITNDIDMENGTVVATPSTAVAGSTVTLKIYPAAGYYLANDDDIEVDGTSTVAVTKVNAGTFTFEMPDEDVTVYALFSAYSGTYYTLVNNTANLIPGRHYIIANSKEAGDAYVMGGQSSGYRDVVSATIIGNTIYQTANVREIVLSGDNTNFWSLYDDGTGAASQGYLYAAGNENKLNVNGEYSEDDKYKWAISIDGDGVANIVSQVEGSNTIRFNNTASPKRFSCYASGQLSVYLYMKGGETDYELYSNTNYSTLTIGELDIYTVHSPAIMRVSGSLTNDGDPENLVVEEGGQLYIPSSVSATVEKTIEAAQDNSDNNWYLVASPLTSTSTSVLTTGHSYNLYKYNEADAAWNGNGGSNAFSTLDKGIGYLYRKADDNTISFAGTLTCGNVSGIDLYKTNDDLPGFNLLGNPYSHNITSSCITLTESGAAFTGAYTLSTSGEWLAEVETGFRPCEGFLVQVNKTTKATIHETPQSKDKYNNEYIRFNVSNSQYEDAAFAMFDKGFGLNKINHRNADVPMLYIPQNGQDYAIAMMSDDTKSFNLNFKAATMGQYTLSYKANGEYNYIHVIDRLTGADVDMLLEGEYSFVASPADNEARFIVKLSYMPDYGEGDSDIFAYQSGSSILVSGEGELQIFDVTGRNVMTTTINGAETINGLNAGVYIFRLNEKAQKIVVR